MAAGLARLNCAASSAGVAVMVDVLMSGTPSVTRQQMRFLQHKVSVPIYYRRLNVYVFGLITLIAMAGGSRSKHRRRNKKRRLL